MSERIWSATRRLEFIDFRLYWHGRINRRDLRQMFGISVPQAANDLRAYQEAAPDNAVYDRRLKTYIAGKLFQPAFFRPDAAEYFEHLRHAEDTDNKLGQPWVAPDIPLAVSPIIKRKMSPDIVRAVISAIRDKHSLQITYQSMTSARPKSRIISPHAVASDGFRWHTRAYLHEKNVYQDFVFARILKADIAENLYIDDRRDNTWHEMITVVLAPNSDLEPAQRRAYEFDLGMIGGELHVPVRRALLHYFLTEMRLDFDDSSKKLPRVTPLAVLNRSEVNKKCLLGDN